MRKAKKMLSLFTYPLVVVLFLGAAVVCSAQDARYIGGAGITVFADANFRGTTQTFQYDVPDLRSSGLDNKISSLRIGPGEQWEVCENRNYGGRCIVVSGQESDLRRNGWSDRISSVRRAGGGGGWNPGNPGGGRPPSWAVGTFYGQSPQNGSQIILTVAADGNVTANVGGSSSYGSMNGNTMNINGAVARISRQGDGILTTRVDNGERIYYSRSGNGGGWNPGNPGWGGGNTSTPPSWAQGTFRGQAGDGSWISLTLERNGRVTANVGGSMSYGTYYNGMITINGAVSQVTKTNRGIRTRRTDNGEVIDYRK